MQIWKPEWKVYETIDQEGYWTDCAQAWECVKTCAITCEKESWNVKKALAELFALGRPGGRESNAEDDCQVQQVDKQQISQLNVNRRYHISGIRTHSQNKNFSRSQSVRERRSFPKRIRTSKHPVRFLGQRLHDGTDPGLRKLREDVPEFDRWRKIWIWRTVADKEAKQDVTKKHRPQDVGHAAMTFHYCQILLFQ